MNKTLIQYGKPPRERQRLASIASRGRKDKISIETVMKMHTLNSQGVGYKTICKKVGCSISTVSYYLSRNAKRTKWVDNLATKHQIGA